MLKAGDVVRFAVKLVTFVEYLHEKHIMVVTPAHLGEGAIKNNIIWDSKLYVSANLFGYEYSKYEDEIEVDRYGCNYIQRFDSKQALFKYYRIKTRTPKLLLDYSFSEDALPLHKIRSDVELEAEIGTDHLNGVIYDECNGDDDIMVQAFRGLIYYINKRYLLPL